jgi:hypothetical protein
MNLIFCVLLLSANPPCDCKDGICPLPAFVPVVIKSTISPLDDATAAIKDDVAKVSSLNKNATALKAALLQATEDLKTFNDKLATDRKTLNDLLDGVNLPPVIQKVVQIVEITTPHCPYCDTDAEIASYVKSGINIVKGTQFTTTGTPTYVCTVDGKEINRTIGKLTEAQLLIWYNATVKWANP